MNEGSFSRQEVQKEREAGMKKGKLYMKFMKEHRKEKRREVYEGR